MFDYLVANKDVIFEATPAATFAASSDAELRAACSKTQLLKY